MTVNHSLYFKDPETGVHSNTIESSWRHSKASMSNYCRKKTFYAGYLAKYMFTKHCRSHKLDPTAEFLKQAGLVYNKNNTEHDGHSGNEDNSDDSDDSDDSGDEDNIYGEYDEQDDENEDSN
ncbi:uncharacterized protein LOC126555581 [Aphis gossypii]|uniref:uncharacterized protein LOC126555581 n=1 Tax=Aphis gossypii TaxID=80765 RepID=UPI002158EBFF|nr:uncharacterized protein LOC126555581 [Aphis gossypii]